MSASHDKQTGLICSGRFKQKTDVILSFFFFFFFNVTATLRLQQKDQGNKEKGREDPWEAILIKIMTCTKMVVKC